MTLGYCGQTDAWMKMKLVTQVGLGSGHIVLDGDPAPLPQRGTAPNFRPISVVAKRLYGSRWHLEVGLGPGHIVLDGDPAPFPQRGGTSPQFSAHFYCGQTAGWIKMSLGMEVGLDPGDVVLDGDPAPPKRGTAAPRFSAHVYGGHGRPSHLLVSSCK